MYYNKAEMLVCHYMCDVRFAKKNSSKKAHCCNMVAYILNQDHILALNVVNVSVNNRISRSIYEYIQMKNHMVVFIVHGSSDREQF